MAEKVAGWATQHGEAKHLNQICDLKHSSLTTAVSIDGTWFVQNVLRLSNICQVQA